MNKKATPDTQKFYLGYLPRTEDKGQIPNYTMSINRSKKFFNILDY